MDLKRIYQTELYKMLRRRINLILLIPVLLALLIIIGYNSGNLVLGVVGEENTTLYSCLDFVMLVWTFISATGLYALLMILVAAYQFSGEIEQGQIKLMLLRIGNRSNLLVGKALALLTLTILSVLLFLGTIIAAYYVYLVPSNTVSGNFSVTMMDLQNYQVIGTVIASFISFLFFMILTYFIGVKGSPFMTFIITLVLMFITKTLVGIESLSFMKYTSFYLENQYMIGNQFSSSNVLIAFIVTFFLIVFIFILAITRFNKIDIK